MQIAFKIKDPEISKLIEKQKKITEERFGEKKSNSEIAEALFLTGAYRRVAARRWAAANEPSKRKPKAKSAKKAVKAKKPAPKKVAKAKKPAPKKRTISPKQATGNRPMHIGEKPISKTEASAPQVNAASLD